MQTFLAAESDATCKRNAFVFLANCAMPKAVEYVAQVHDQIGSLDELLQMAIIDVIRLDCKSDSTHRVGDIVSGCLSDENDHIQPRWIRSIFELLNASSHAVQYEAATTLTTLTQHATAVKGLHLLAVSIVFSNCWEIAAATTFIKLVSKESDNNVKLIVLDRLDALRSKHGHVFDNLIMDVLQVLSRYFYISARLTVNSRCSAPTSKYVERPLASL